MIATDVEIPSREEYERMAYEYMATLPLEHLPEARVSATQRMITVASLDLLSARRPDVQVCNEMLVTYPRSYSRRGEVLPDNMVLIRVERIGPYENLEVDNTASPIFMVIDYVLNRRAKQRKDYETNRLKYERELKVPYYMLFDPEAKKLTLLRLEGSTFVDVRPNAQGRLPIPALDLEIAVLDGWVRYWYQGELLPLPAEMQAELESLRERADRAELRAEQEKQRADQEKQPAEQEKQRAVQEKQRADAESERARKMAQKLRTLGVDPDA